MAATPRDPETSAPRGRSRDAAPAREDGFYPARRLRVRGDAGESLKQRYWQDRMLSGISNC
jgi:hypothetical protein